MSKETADPDNVELRLLVSRVLDGDEDAFGDIFMKCRPFVRRVLRQFCDDEDSIDEEVGNLFYPRFHRYILMNRAKMLENPRAYLHRMAITHGINMRRKAQRERDRTADVDDGDLPGSSDPSKDAEMKEVRRRFQIEVNKLPPKEREAVILVDAEGNSYEEAASIMKAPIGSVKGWVSRGRRRLQVALAPVHPSK